MGGAYNTCEVMDDCIILSSDSEEEIMAPLLERIAREPTTTGTNRKRQNEVVEEEGDSDDSSSDSLPSFPYLFKRNQPKSSLTSIGQCPSLTSSIGQCPSLTRSIGQSSSVNNIKLDRPESVQSTSGVTTKRNKKTEGLLTDSQGGRDSVSDSKEKKRQKALELQEAKKRERERKKTEKKQEKTLKKLVNQVETDSRKEKQPGARVKQMIVQIDTSLSNNNLELMESLDSTLQEMEVQYRIVQASSCASVTWKRRNVTRSLNEDMTDVVENSEEVDEQYMLVVMSGKEYVNYIRVSKLAQSGQPSSDESLTLLEYVQLLVQDHPTRKIVLVVENLDAALKGQKTKRNRIFRTAVRTNQTDATLPPQIEVSSFDCDEFMTQLYLSTGCWVRVCSTPEQVADVIITYTKALADIPFKKDSSFSFYGDLGPGASRKSLKESKNEVGLIWQYQLQQYPGVSHPIATAIVSHYPSPSHLLKAYDECSTVKEGELLLKDIEVRRGAGIIASTRRIGASVSQRIYAAMTCDEASKLLPN